MSTKHAEDICQLLARPGAGPLRKRFVEDRLTAGDVATIILHCHNEEPTSRGQMGRVRKQVLDISREYSTGSSNSIPLACLHVVLRDVAQIHGRPWRDTCRHGPYALARAPLGYIYI